MGDVAGVTGFGDGAGDGGVIELLLVVLLVAAGDAGRVIEGDPLVIVLDGADDVALHARGLLELGDRGRRSLRSHRQCGSSRDEEAASHS